MILADEPITLLTRFLSKGKESPDEKTNLIVREQLELYMAFGFAAGPSGYNLAFLNDIITIDKLDMMSHDGKRAEQVVEAMRALRQPTGFDIGLQPVDNKRRP